MSRRCLRRWDVDASDGGGSQFWTSRKRVFVRKLSTCEHSAQPRAARQKAFGVYIPGNDDLCNSPLQKNLGITWYRFLRNADDEAQWVRKSAALLRTVNDRLAGWIRHAISIYARQMDGVSDCASKFLTERIPIVPLVAERSRNNRGIAFQPPSVIVFHEEVEVIKTIRDWQRHRPARNPNSRFTVYRPIPGTRLVRFVGT